MKLSNEKRYSRENETSDNSAAAKKIYPEMTSLLRGTNQRAIGGARGILN